MRFSSLVFVAFMAGSGRKAEAARQPSGPAAAAARRPHTREQCCSDEKCREKGGMVQNGVCVLCGRKHCKKPVEGSSYGRKEDPSLPCGNALTGDGEMCDVCTRGNQSKPRITSCGADGCSGTVVDAFCNLCGQKHCTFSRGDTGNKSVCGKPIAPDREKRCKECQDLVDPLRRGLRCPRHRKR